MVKFITLVAIAVCMVVGIQTVDANEPKLALTGQLPYHVSIHGSHKHGTIPQHLCSGVIVNERWILTSAHCIVNYSDMTLRIHAGSTHKYENGQDYKVAEVVYHDDLDFSDPDTINSSLAMIKTTESIQFGENVRAIAMSHKYIVAGELATISGWKKPTNDGDSDHLRYALLNTVSTKRCVERYEHNGNLVNSKTLCGKYISALPISDYGCPLVAHGRVIGISLPNDRPGRPNRFVRMSLFADWVESVAKRL